MKKLVEAEQQTKLTGHRWEVTSLEFSPNGLFLASAAWDKEVRLWDLSTLGTWGYLTNQHQLPVTSLAWKPGETSNILATTSSDQTSCLWKTDTGEVLQVLEHDDWVLDCTFSLDEQHLATGCWDRTLRIWDIETAKIVNSFSGHSSGIWTCKYSPVSPHVVCSGTEDGSIKVFDTRNNNLVLSLIGGHEDSVKCCSWSVDGRHLASGGVDMKIAVWDATTGSLVSRIRGHEDTVTDLKFYPILGQKEMPFILSTGDNTCRFWHAMRKDNKELMCLRQHENGAEVQCLAISQDGTLIATGGRDGQIILSSLNVFVNDVEALSSSNNQSNGARLWKKCTRKVLQRISVSGSESCSSDYKSSDEDAIFDNHQEVDDIHLSAAVMVGAAIQRTTHDQEDTSNKETTAGSERVPSQGTIMLKNKRTHLRHVDENNVHFNGFSTSDHEDSPPQHTQEETNHIQPISNGRVVFHHKNKPIVKHAVIPENKSEESQHSMTNGVLVHHGKTQSKDKMKDNSEEFMSRL